MIIGVPKEIKDNEYRVAIVPAIVQELTALGHTVLIEKNAGLGSGISDDEFRRAGACIRTGPKTIFSEAEMIIKVKEPLPREYPLLRKGQILFTFLHLAPNRDLTQALLERQVIAIGYETIQTPDKKLPLLTPMSEVAGKLSVQLGAHYLQKDEGGRGILLGGIPGVAKGEVTVLGGGTAGINAAKIALGMGATVRILDINPARLTYLEDTLGKGVITLISNRQNIEESVINCDLLIGAVLVTGQRTPHLVNKTLVSRMRKGSVIVDIAIDQGGCVATSRPTTHSEPTFSVNGVIHYCVCNIPGIVARSSTYALTNLSGPFILKIADNGFESAVTTNSPLAAGVNIYMDKITCPGVAKALDLPYNPLLPITKTN